MPSAGRRDFPLRRVTLGSGQGALGTWRAAHHLEALPDTWCQIPVRSSRRYNGAVKGCMQTSA